MSQNPHLSRILEWIQRFQEGSLTLTELWKNLALIPSLLESNVPLRVRTAIQTCANDLEILDETAQGPSAVDRAREMTHALEILVSDYLAE
jgi:hypothetical protein